MEKKELAVREEILGSNKKVAAEIRSKFEAAGVLVVNLLSSPGSGKTTLLERIVETLKLTHPLAVIEGDLETERDADRIRRKGVPAWQITTGGACHLEARMIGKLVPEIRPRPGSCSSRTSATSSARHARPGENIRCVLLSAPEGDDKPKKYPRAFATAELSDHHQVGPVPVSAL
jgi:hydrogenase nickel incorporation protein HypB